jgi:hypothetical protein
MAKAFVLVGYDHYRPFSGVRLGNRATNPACRTSHQGSLSGKSHTFS